MTTTEKIQKVKRFLINNAFSYNWNNASKKGLADEAETIINLVVISNSGFASEIATTVEKCRRISEKQAYWIAKIAVETGIDSRIKFLYD